MKTPLKNHSFVAVDIGNTSTLFAHCSGRKIGAQFRVSTNALNAGALRACARKFKGKKISAFVIASVVPKASLFLKRNIPSQLGLPALLIGKDLKAPIRNGYRNPKQVGMDRLMNGVAVLHEYKKDAIVIDFGTAITLDIVSKKGGYLGGIIAPGIELSLEALFQKTALLPKIHLKHPNAIVGKDTVQSIRIGCSYGIGGLCDRLVELTQAKLGRKPLVLATGGYASFMKRYCRAISKVDPNLVLKGIAQTYRASIKAAK